MKKSLLIITYILLLVLFFNPYASAKTRTKKSGSKSFKGHKHQLALNYKRPGLTINSTAIGTVWILSIGIDDYGENKYISCESDARSYVEFFKGEYQHHYHPKKIDSVFRSYLLLGSQATRAAIINVLKEIASKAKYDDTFIFNFSGLSDVTSQDSTISQTYLFPFETAVVNHRAAMRDQKDTSNVFNKLISLETLQEYTQQIAANNQLFIAEAGRSDKFKPDFIKALLHNSPTVASVLNKNCIIIVPNNVGYEWINENKDSYKQGLINYFITSLDTAHNNIYDLFNTNKAPALANRLKNRQYELNNAVSDYFDIFFERQFLQQYHEIFDDNEKTRGIKGVKSAVPNPNTGGAGKSYAMVIGTDHYNAKDWAQLANPIFDATEVAGELKRDYGFETKLLKDAPMDSIYSHITQYYQTLKPADQLVIYIAGHGDSDPFLDDGFIVCNDSKGPEADPMHNTYIQYAKLLKMLNKIPAKRILLMLDVCYGGSVEKSTNGVNANVLDLLTESGQFQVRKILSSTGKQPAFDGAAGRHSPFAGLLLQILNAKGAQTNNMITLSQIYAVLQNASLNKTPALRTTPYESGFGYDNPNGEFILVPVQQPAGAVASTN
jgi:uncharacterized caspase-like protein